MRVAAQDGTQAFQDCRMRQRASIHQPVDFDRHGKTRGDMTRQAAEKRLQQSGFVR